MSKNSIELDLEAYRVAREARNFEIKLFWQRSNYFLVLSTAIAVGFFTLQDPKYAVLLASFGFMVGLLWIAMNIGSKFWQGRWEHRLCLTEQQLRPDMNLYSATLETVHDDVKQSFTFRKRGFVYRLYARLVLLDIVSVTFVMTTLSVLFTVFWIVILVVTFLT